jgi:putative ATP-binding cassette transporter
VAAANGESVQTDMHHKLYRDIDRTWAKQNWISTAYSGFGSIYDYVAFRIVAYSPGLLPYMDQKLSFKEYITGAEMVNQVIRQCSWFIHVMPAIASLKANSRRLTDLAEAIERVQQPADFYRQTGRFDFRFGRQHSTFGLTIRNLELAHAGDDTVPFVTAPTLRFRRGEWTFLKGESGCGKSSLIKAINGLWPHGSGEIVLPEGVSTFYAAQDIRLPQVSLKQLVCLPSSDDSRSHAAVAAALHRSGLGEFIEFMGEACRDGKSWDETLSGGQKQKLVLARILLHKPGLLFLDEATGALDTEAKIAFHQVIKDQCPGITVISVMHEIKPPRALTGVDFYDSVLTIADGMATKAPLRPDLPEEITKILTEPAKAVRMTPPKVRQNLR